MSKEILTQARLKELLHYNPATGVFTWIISRKYNATAGTIAGGVDSYGYSRIRVDNTRHRAHRLAWLYMTGEWPANAIDHINGVRNCNIFANLREATTAQNNINVGIRKDNTSGYKGVTWRKSTNRWLAQASINGKVTHLGSFKTPELASKAYQEITQKHFGDFYRNT